MIKRFFQSILLISINSISAMVEPAPEVEQWCKDVLKKCGVTNNVTVKLANNYFSATKNNTLYIDESDQEKILQALKNNNADTLHDPYMSIAHEGGHLKNNDSLRAGLSVPIIYTTSSTLYNLTRTILGNKTSKNPVNIPTLASTFLGYNLYKRHREWQADKFAIGHARCTEDLYAHANYHEHHYKQVKPFLLCKDNNNIFTQRFCYAVQYDLAHPFPLDRAQLFRDAAAKLEEKQKSSNNC